MNIPNDWAATPSGQARARGLGLPLPGRPGPANAITDIASLEVGYCTLVTAKDRWCAAKARCARGSRPYCRTADPAPQ
jgi:hypothetical protein